MRSLRALTYLAPGIPLEFFELVTGCLARALGRDVSLGVESRSSGPMHGQLDPFSEGAEGLVDLGFLCSPSYLYLSACERPSVWLVPAAFVFADPRSDGEPVYFSEVAVRRDHPARRFSDLEGSVWGFNDECSLSGYFAALQKIAELGCENGFFRQSVQTGSHHASIDALLAGSIDGAAIDSTVMAIALRERPELAVGLRVLESWGPFPIQPVVVRSGLGVTLAEDVAEAMLGLHLAPAFRHLYERFGLQRCAPIDDGAFREERRALSSLGYLENPHGARVFP